MEILRADGSVGRRVCNPHIAMASNRSDGQKERLVRLDSPIEEGICFAADNVCGVVALVAHWWISITLESAVEVLVRIWVK